MKKIITIAAMCLSGLVMSAPTSHWVTVDSEILTKIRPKLNKSVQSVFSAQGATVVKLSSSEIEKLSKVIHHDLHRCGGFIQHESLEEATAALTSQGEMYFAKRAVFAEYSINRASVVRPMMSQVSDASIQAMIEKLTTFNNRHYMSETGVQSAGFIRDTWATMTKKRNDVKVNLYNHKKWPQPSIVMTILGSEFPDEIVIVGGHADSISSGFGGASKKRAPGADDNASGIATITETIRILMNSNYKPKRTVQFIGYAAEEVGLLGSKEIALEYKKDNKKVIGVMQLDMTLNKGTSDKDIVMMSDFTNAAQNEFLGRLIDEYVKVPWGYSRCGYGCSDHASWTANGFPASMPFESSMNDINRSIHTERDTLESAGGNAKHAAKFAKLSTAFVVELAK